MRRLVTTAAVTTVVALAAPSASYASHAAAHRPVKEHVPHSVHKVALAYRTEPFKPASKHRTVRGARARALVGIFDHLKATPRGQVTCDIAGGPTTTVTFATSKHTWVATEAACSGIRVTRDGVALPILLTTRKWSRAVQHDLKL